jgi:hypothetical protein
MARLAFHQVQQHQRQLGSAEQALAPPFPATAWPSPAAAVAAMRAVTMATLMPMALAMRMVTMMMVSMAAVAMLMFVVAVVVLAMFVM